MGRVRWISTIRRFRVPLWRHDEKVSRQNSLMNLENLVRNLISSNYQFQKKKSRYEIYLKWYFFFKWEICNEIWYFNNRDTSVTSLWESYVSKSFYKERWFRCEFYSDIYLIHDIVTLF